MAPLLQLGWRCWPVGASCAQGPSGEVLADPATWALGIAEPAETRLRRLLAEAGLLRDPPRSSRPEAG